MTMPAMRVRLRYQGISARERELRRAERDQRES